MRKPTLALKYLILMIFIIIVAIYLLYTHVTIQNNYNLEAHYHECEISRNNTIIDWPEIIDIEPDTSTTTNIDCFRLEGNTLPDISELNPRPGKSIFFHETSCRSHAEGKITISPRQACAVESAARQNPNLDVYLLYTSPGRFKFDCRESDSFLKQLLTYENIKIAHINYGNYVKNTPVESLYQSGALEGSYYAVAHASDILRYLTLWKYGGIYLDMDVISTKPLEGLKLNFAAVQSGVEVAAGALSFDASGDGHEWVETCLNDLKTHFSGSSWSDSSVGVITRLLETLCGVSQVSDMLKSDCRGFNVLPQDSFYSISYQSWNLFFSKDSFDYVMKETACSYGIHFWNKLSINRKIKTNATQIPLTHFARTFCPKVFQECRYYF